MPTLDKRIEGKRKEIKLDTGNVQKFKRIESNTGERIDTIEELLDTVLGKQGRKEHILADIEDGFRHGGPNKGEEWDEDKIERAQERLADDLDELTAVELRLVDRVDRQERKSERAKRLLDKWQEERDQDQKRIKYLRRKRERIESKKDQLSQNFSVAEFDCNDGTPVPTASIPALEHMCENYLERLRRQYGLVIVNSGYRHAAYNRSIGGATNSIHIYDLHSGAVAVDHWLRTASPALVYSFHTQANPGGLGKYATFTHIDNRQRIGWATARWNG